MFRKPVITLSDLILRTLREQGLETPLLQKRLIDAWPEVAGPLLAGYTTRIYIYDQTLYVYINRPAIRMELTMRASDYVRRLNEKVGSEVIRKLSVH